MPDFFANNLMPAKAVFAHFVMGLYASKVWDGQCGFGVSGHFEPLAMLSLAIAHTAYTICPPLCGEPSVPLPTRAFVCWKIEARMPVCVDFLVGAVDWQDRGDACGQCDARLLCARTVGGGRHKVRDVRAFAPAGRPERCGRRRCGEHACALPHSSICSLCLCSQINPNAPDSKVLSQMGRALYDRTSRAVTGKIRRPHSTACFTVPPQRTHMPSPPSPSSIVTPSSASR